MVGGKGKENGENAQRRVGGVGEGGAATVDTDGDTADEVAAADSDAGPEEGEAGEVAVGMIEIGVVNVADVGGEDDGHDDAVDGDDLAEDDGDQVLGPDARGPDAGAQDGRAGDEDAPVGLFDSARQLSVYKTIPYTRLCDRDGIGP